MSSWPTSSSTPCPSIAIEQRDGRLLERFVDWDEEPGRLVERPGEPSTPALAARLGATGQPSSTARSARSAWSVEPWLAEVAADLERGLVLVIDYGHRAPALYDPARRGGTLRAYSGQRAHADPFIAVGRQDLTAHVDLTALEAAARADGLAVLGDVSQAELLLGCGLEELLDRIRSNPADDDGGVARRSARRSRGSSIRPPSAASGRSCSGAASTPPLIGLTRA